MNIWDRSFSMQSLLFYADKLKALGVAKHFPFSAKVSVEANRKSQRSEKWNDLSLLNMRTATGDETEHSSPHNVIWIAQCLLVNPEFSSRNPESTWRLKSGIQYLEYGIHSDMVSRIVVDNLATKTILVKSN